MNRFEKKKNLLLALDSFAWLKGNLDAKVFRDLRLLVGGDYNSKIKENVKCLWELQVRCKKLGLNFVTIWPTEGLDEFDVNECEEASVFFLPAINDAMRNSLLARSFTLIYTPTEEHVGIVPIEAMALGIPPIGINNGGTKEAIVDGATGFLVDPVPSTIGSRLKLLLGGKVNLTKMSDEARKHVDSNFSLERFGNHLESILYEMQFQGNQETF